MGHQHHISKHKSYQRAIAVLKERMAKHKKITVAYKLADFDNVIHALNDVGIYVPFNKPTDTFNAKYCTYLLAVEWSNKYHKYVKSDSPSTTTLNWDYVDMTL